MSVCTTTSTPARRAASVGSLTSATRQVTPGGVAPVIVDRDDAADQRRVSEPDSQRLPDSAGRTGDRHNRRRRGGATLTANAALSGEPAVCRFSKSAAPE